MAGISYNTDEQSLREAFAKYGEVVDGKWLFSSCYLYEVQAMLILYGYYTLLASISVTRILHIVC